MKHLLSNISFLVFFVLPALVFSVLDLVLIILYALGRNVKWLKWLNYMTELLITVSFSFQLWLSKTWYGKWALFHVSRLSSSIRELIRY